MGLTPDALIEMAGNQYRIVASEGDLVTVEPGVQSAQGLAQGTELVRVRSEEWRQYLSNDSRLTPLAVRPVEEDRGVNQLRATVLLKG